jgi:hypothetical protein
MRLSRRGLLQAAGVAGLGWLAKDAVFRRAQAEEAPQRLLVVLTPNGTMYDHFRLRPAGLPDAPGTQGWEVPLAGMTRDELPELLRPLHPVRGKISVFDGLSLYSAAAGEWFRAVHAYGQAAVLSGSVPTYAGAHGEFTAYPSKRTLDQAIADRISRPDRLHSIHMRVGLEAALFSAAEPGSSLPFVDDPFRLYSQLFPLHGTPGVHGPGLDRARSRVREVVQARFAEALKRTSAADRQRLEAHRDLLADTDRRMDALMESACVPLPAPDAPPGGFTQASFKAGQQMPTSVLYEKSYQAFLDMTLAAFACDLVRVAVLDVGEMPGPIFGAPVGLETHFGIAHFADDPAEVEKRNWMREYHRVLGERVRRIIERLDATPDVGGGTMLDNTAVLWCSEVASGSHRLWDWNAIVAGGRGHRAGRYRRFQPSLPRPWDRETERPDLVDLQYFGPPHNQLLAGVAKTFGLGGDGFGDGLLRSVTVYGQRTQDVDLRGVIDLA